MNNPCFLRSNLADFIRNIPDIVKNDYLDRELSLIQTI